MSLWTSRKLSNICVILAVLLFLAGVLAEAASLFAAAIAVMALDLAQTLIFYRCPHCGWLLPFRHWSVPHCCPGCGRELNAPGR